MDLRSHDFFPGSIRASSQYERILSRLGRNYYGEPIFRIVMLSSRCYFSGGWWEIEQEYGYKLVPKYAKAEHKWALERWLPPSKYGNPKLWEQQTLSHEGFLQVGPFPIHGEYECCEVFSVGKGPEGKVIVVTILDAETVGMADEESEIFYLAQTQRSLESRGNPAITLEKSSKFTSKEYIEELSKKTGEYYEPTEGNGISGILTSPYWFLKKVKSLAEQLCW